MDTSNQSDRDKLIREKRIELIRRMARNYNKNRSKIEGRPKEPELSQSEKRERKLADLNSRINSWKGLESFNKLIDENQ